MGKQRVSDNEPYYWLHITVKKALETHDYLDDGMYEKGNYFTSKEEAIEKAKELLESLNKESNEGKEIKEI